MKKVASHVVLCWTFPLSAMSMGLGDLRVTSNLDQPFEAEVVVLDVANTPLPSLKITAASDDSYARVGMTKSFAVSLLKFELGRNAKGKMVVKITSTERITEPYIDLLLDLAWPTGQVYKEYQILLDPPGYALYIPGGMRVKASYTSYTYRNDTHTNVFAKAPAVPAIYAAATPVQEKQLTYGPVAQGEMIWQIAQHYKIPELQLSQLVLAIVGMNPNAFDDGNLNGLKPGVRLLIPSVSLVEKIPADLAAKEVLAQDQAWKTKTPVQHIINPPYYPAHALPAHDTLAIRNDVYFSKLPSAPVFTAETQKTASLSSWIINEIPGAKSAKEDLPVTAPPTTTMPTSATPAQPVAAVNNDEINAQLKQQLLLLQEQNKTLKQFLEKRDADFAEIKQQLNTLTVQRQSAGAQVHTSEPKTESSSSWYLWLLFLAAGGGLIYGLWRSNQPLPVLVQQGLGKLRRSPKDTDDTDDSVDTEKMKNDEDDISSENVSLKMNTIKKPVVEQEPEIKPIIPMKASDPMPVEPEPELKPEPEPEPELKSEPEPEEASPTVPEVKEEEVSHVEYVPPDISALKSEHSVENKKHAAPINDENMIEYQTGLLGEANAEETFEPFYHHDEDPVIEMDNEEDPVIEMDNTSEEPIIDLPPVVPEKPTAMPEEPIRPEEIKPIKSEQALDTLLALAETYISMGDDESAKQSLKEVLEFGTGPQQHEAMKMLDKLGKK